MPSKHHLNVSLTEHLVRFTADQVASGRFGSASEVVRAGLRLLERELAAAPAAPRNDAAMDGHAVPSGLATPGATAPRGPKGRSP
jgi:antitoxin ParD1/3/4